jgi:2,5-furandicarboxylate decarboxylase 1
VRVQKSTDQIAQLAQKIRALIEKEPKYYSEIAEQFSDYGFNLVARALGKLHTDEILWQDPRGRMCIRGSSFAATRPVRG